MGRKGSQVAGKRFLCPCQGCKTTLKNKDELKLRHFQKHHAAEGFVWDPKQVNALTPEEITAFENGQLVLEFPQIASTMDNSAGRGQREKKPSEKVKEAIASKLDGAIEDPNRKTPPIYTADHVKASAEVKEIEKIPSHTKITADGEKYEMYTLGPHIENKDKRVYIRASQDPETMYFHAVEAPPCHARISDEGHNLCAVEKIENSFSRDMRTKAGELGQYTTRANVFAREGQFFWEAKIVSTSPLANMNMTDEPLQLRQPKDKTSCERGTIRVGFARREQAMTQPIGFQGYSYCAYRTGNNKYGSVMFRQTMFKIQGKEYPNPKSGDVIGLMITLPSLEIHDQVVKGTYNPADHPTLSYGPLDIKDVKKKPAGGKKSMAKPKSAVAKGKEKASSEGAELTNIRDRARALANAEYDITTPATLDILRDRNPFTFKNNLVYFECPDYTPRPDLIHTATRGRTINPETGKPWETLTDSHPCHELPWLRTLPGSKIEVWINGEYMGIACEHLLAFLPPASYIEKSAKASQLYGDVDDGMLGYYPALSHYGGGTVECKFDGPWWYGFDKEKFPNARAFGERYNEHIIEDVVSDIVDELCIEAKYGKDYMKKAVESTRLPAGMVNFTGHGVQGSSSK